MPAWSEPQDLTTWLKRGMTFRTAVMCLSVLALLVSEVRFNWVEFLVGRYLLVTNAHRPELGSVWELGHQRQVATQTLEQMVTQKRTARREAREAATLVALIEGLPTSQGVIISAAHFKTLYSQLSDAVARSLFSPVRLLRISAEGSWDRVYLERENGKVGIYLLDDANNVLSYTTLTDQQLQQTAMESPATIASLDDQPEFSGRIYPASRFFSALDTLPPEVQREVIVQPDLLLATEGTPLRVGISNEVNADMIRIGVEMDTPDGRQVILAMGQGWAVWQVRMLLEPRSVPPSVDRRRHLQRGDP
jgi:hypothetical protein